MNNWIKTGNEFADSIFTARFLEDPIMQALVDYLEAKGVLNKVEFAQYVNEHCRADVEARERLSREQD